MKRLEMEPTPEGRIAVAAVATIRHFATMHRRLPDIADLRDDLKIQIRRELILAKLEGLRTHRDKCEEEIRKMTLELADLI